MLGGTRISEARQTKTARPQKPKPAATRRRVAPVGPSPPVHETKGRQIRITHEAMRAIREECARWHGQVETGGGLTLSLAGAAGDHRRHRDRD